MKNLLSVLFIALSFACAAQTQSDSVVIAQNEYAITELSKMSQDFSIHIDSVICHCNTSKENLLILATAAKIDSKKVKMLSSEKSKSILVYFRKEIMIGNY